MNPINCKCLSISQQYEFDIPSNVIYPQAILVDDVNEDNVTKLFLLLKKYLNFVLKEK
jgi:hypothetical protein